MTLSQVRNVADDHQKNSRWATVLIFDGVHTNSVNLRIVGIGRVFVRVMHANGHSRNVVADDITNAW